MFHLRQPVREVPLEQWRLHPAALENVRTPFMDGLFISDRFSLLCVDMRLCACVRVCTSRFICTARQEGRLEGDVCRVDGVSGLQLSLLLQDLVTSLWGLKKQQLQFNTSIASRGGSCSKTRELFPLCSLYSAWITGQKWRNWCLGII